MIIDLERFVAQEQAHWDELAGMLDALEDQRARLDLPRAERLHYLYQRAASGLARLATFSAESDLRRSLEALVARAYAEIHAETGAPGAASDWRAPLRWLLGTLPRTFRRHAAAFWLSLAVTALGTAFGTLTVAIDPDSRAVTMPFGHDETTPSERVADELEDRGERMAGRQAQFSGFLMANNIKVSIGAMALGLTWGVGTVVLLFYNGVGLGAIGLDYIRDGQGTFLAGWLLPHGSVEIPAILVAGQAGLLLAGALVGWGRRVSLGERLRGVRDDVVTLIGGVALLLVWAGIIEAFFSQYHEPVLPYWIKITFGTVQLAALFLYLGLAGRPRPDAVAR